MGVNPLGLKFQELVAWYRRECDRTDVTLSDILSGVPKFYRAIMDQIKEAEAAYHADSPQRIAEAIGRIKKLYSRAVEQYQKIRG